MLAMGDPRTKKRRTPGVGGKNIQTGILLREGTAGQLDSWRDAAKRAGLTLTVWIRRTLDRAAAAGR
jgi:hypothetical protein